MSKCTFNGKYWTMNLRQPNGKYKKIYSRISEKDCKEKYEKEKAKVITGEYLVPDKTTYKEWIDVWRNDYALNIKPNTIDSYNRTINNIIIPVFGEQKLQKIRTPDVQKWINSLKEEYKPASIQLIFTIFKRTLNDAKKEGIIRKNPCDGVRTDRIPKNNMCIISQEEMKEYLDYCYQDNPFYAQGIEFILLTGLRFSEFAGLTFDRFNARKKTINIDRQFIKDIGFCTPKDDSYRTILIPDRAIELIEKQRKYIEEKRKNNPEYNPNNFIFPSKKGEVMSKTTFISYVKRNGKLIGIDNLKTHDLRHSYASMLLNLTGNIKLVQENLGHKSAAFTLDRYAHISIDVERRAADLLNSIY